jgi:hypothetical protein
MGEHVEDSTFSRDFLLTLSLLHNIPTPLELTPPLLGFKPRSIEQTLKNYKIDLLVA